jgi:sigma-B regulation protein RsbU (phosphoserine phosphatase)
MLDFADAMLSEERLDLAPGDRLVMYTDGLTDVFNPAGERFGPERLAALLEELAHLFAAELCDATFAALRDYQGQASQFDDMTMLALVLDN